MTGTPEPAEAAAEPATAPDGKTANRRCPSDDVRWRLIGTARDGLVFTSPIFVSYDDVLVRLFVLPLPYLFQPIKGSSGSLFAKYYETTRYVTLQLSFISNCIFPNVVVFNCGIM